MYSLFWAGTTLKGRCKKAPVLGTTFESPSLWEKSFSIGLTFEIVLGEKNITLF